MAADAGVLNYFGHMPLDRVTTSVQASPLRVSAGIATTSDRFSADLPAGERLSSNFRKFSGVQEFNALLVRRSACSR